MAKQSKTLDILAKKLGLSEEDKVLSKAAELERLLQTKSTASTITDTAKAVICLELAATCYRVEFDQKLAIKSSGLKGPSYINSKKIIENVLELNNSRLTIPGLCLSLQCSVQDLAEQILEEYKRKSKMELDMDLPQYVCMAVYQACRINKIKVPKRKLLDKSQLKPGQWSKLDAEWTKFTDEKFAALVKKKKGRPGKKSVTEDDEEKMDVDTQATAKQDEPMEPQIETYEDWKTRILEAAYKELEMLKQNLDTNKQKLPSSKQKESNKHLGVLNEQKDSPATQKRSSRDPILNANKKLDFESPNTRSGKQKESPSKLKETPSKQKETPSKQKETPSKLKENNIRSIVNASRNLDFECSPNTRSSNKQVEIPSKQGQTPSKQRETPGKLKENNNNKQTGSASKQLDFDFTPRRSPRKTPQKFEPYPVKPGGVRLLFPL